MQFGILCFKKLYNKIFIFIKRKFIYNPGGNYDLALYGPQLVFHELSGRYDKTLAWGYTGQYAKNGQPQY